MSRTLHPDEFRSCFPQASESTVAANTRAWAKECGEEREAAVRAVDGAAAPNREEDRPELESNRGNELSPALRRTGGDTKKHLVVYEIRRHRLIRDIENICTKAFTDALRYAGLIPEDNSDALKIEFTQTQVPKEEECTIIAIYPPGTW